MALTVTSAFQQFRNSIDLTKADSDNAKSSRNYLQEQIQTTMSKDGVFPKITGTFYNYGSFARKTKLAPLNDVDFMVKVNAADTSLVSSMFSNIVRIKANSAKSPLYRFADSATMMVSSVRVLNGMKTSVQSHSTYRRSPVVRNQQAVILNLTSYDWSFDIVPAVGVAADGAASKYFLIPDGNGDWMKTDPRIDASRTSTINQKHESKLLAVIRMLKHWNNRGGKTRMRSFHFETIVLKVFEYAPKITSERAAIKYFFENAPVYVQSACTSPSGFGPNLDTYLTQEDRNGIVTAMKRAVNNIALAGVANLSNDNKTAIGYWRLVFGDTFPTYG